MATADARRRRAELTANAPYPTAKGNYANSYVPSTQAEYGMTPEAARIKPLTTPGPSIGDRVGSFIRSITPGSADAGYGQNLYKVGKVSYNAIESTIKSTVKAGKFISDVQQLTQFNLPGIVTNFANIGEAKRKFEATTKLVDDYKYVQQSNEDARRQLQSGAINKKEYNDIIKENTKNLITW